MVGTSINSHKLPLNKSTNIKFLSSYGGKILPRHPDGKLRYYGGYTRVLSVHRSISFAELMVKLREMCGAMSTLRCQLPTEDLDALVSITSDEDLVNLIEEYDRAATASPSSSLKIRAFLSPPKSTKKVVSSPSSTASSSSTTTNTTSSNCDANSPKSFCTTAAASPPTTVTSSWYRGQVNYNEMCVRQTMAKPQMVVPLCYQKAAGKLPQHTYHGLGNTSSHIYLIHHGNHRQ
uniref:Uncharacterized protein LOC104239050 n=1 Tax=Nicotiana sylvestris TaxID=4096 RepID=A0A1U7XIK0_NICSY|nr:PREDICTED: uncharacterized protein LOC104239050 [Nicotiana sylvestris]